MKIYNGFIIALLAASAVPGAYSPAAGQSIDSLRAKMALETQIEERLRLMLSSYLNTRDVAVAAKVNILVKKAETEQGQGVRKWDEKAELILPGVPAATSMTKDTAEAKALEAAKTKARLGVANINIWIIVGKQVTKDQEAKIKKMVSDALDLQAETGDTISIESTPPEKPPRAFHIGAIVSLVCLAVLAVFLYGPFRGFLKRLNDNLSAFAAAAKEGTAAQKAAGGGSGAQPGEETPGEPALSGALNISGGSGQSVLTFDSGEDVPLEKYVTNENVEDLRLILNDESPEIIARVAQRIPPKLAFAAIPKHKMEEVLEEFLTRDYEDPEKIKTLLTRIKDKMAGSFGGPARLGNLVQAMDKRSQKNTLAFLTEKDTSFAAEVETRFFKFEDLLGYDETATRRIFRKAGAEPFARCLKNCDKQPAELFFGMLGPAIKELVEMRIQNMPVVVDSTDAEMIVLSAVNALAAKGLILPLAEVKAKRQVPPPVELKTREQVPLSVIIKTRNQIPPPVEMKTKDQILPPVEMKTKDQVTPPVEMKTKDQVTPPVEMKPAKPAEIKT